VSPREPLKNRVVRVSDRAWQAALDKAEERGEVLSEEIRKFIERYGRKK